MKYLAYGVSLSRKEMARYCPNARFLGTGVLYDWRLMFKGEMPHSYATIEEWEGYSVPFALWEISASDEPALDYFIGYPSHYRKGFLEAEFEGEDVKAMYYFKNPEQRTQPPMLHYYNAVVEAYAELEFDDAPLKEALDFSESCP